MNSMERVAAMLKHQPVDRVPVYPILSGVTRKLVGATYEEWSTNADVCAKALIKARKDFDLDGIVSLIDLSVECEAWGQKIVYQENDAGHPDGSDLVIKDIEDYKKIKKVDIKNAKRMQMHIEVCRQLVADSKGEYPVTAFVFGPLGTLSMLRNQEDMYMDLYDDPDAIKEATREVTETLKDYVNALIDAGVNAIMFDTLFSSGSIMSKDMWTEMEAPFVKELADLCHERGVFVLIHNCGQKIYFDAQIEAMKPDGISFLYPPADCADFKECKEKYGDKTALIGCVPPPLVVTATDEQWIEECKNQIDVLGCDGLGYMLATGCEYPCGADFRKAEIMVQVAKEYTPYNK